jgi:hypothetical protein
MIRSVPKDRIFLVLVADAPTRRATARWTSS